MGEYLGIEMATFQPFIWGEHDHSLKLSLYLNPHVVLYKLSAPNSKVTLSHTSILLGYRMYDFISQTYSSDD